MQYRENVLLGPKSDERKKKPGPLLLVYFMRMVLVIGKPLVIHFKSCLDLFFVPHPILFLSLKQINVYSLHQCQLALYKLTSFLPRLALAVNSKEEAGLSVERNFFLSLILQGNGQYYSVRYKI